MFQFIVTRYIIANCEILFGAFVYDVCVHSAHIRILTHTSPYIRAIINSKLIRARTHFQSASMYVRMYIKHLYTPYTWAYLIGLDARGYYYARTHIIP